MDKAPSKRHLMAMGGEAKAAYADGGEVESDDMRSDSGEGMCPHCHQPMPELDIIKAKDGETAPGNVGIGEDTERTEDDFLKRLKRRRGMSGAIAGVFLAGLLGAPTVEGAPRQNGAILSTTASAPTANPKATLQPTGATPDTAGRSYGVPGALRLTGCTGYRFTVCASSGTLSGAGTLDVYYWPDYVTNYQTPSPWPRNATLDETISTTITTDCAGGACQCETFPDHPTDGLQGGWIYGAPNGITVSSGATVLVLIEAACAT